MKKYLFIALALLVAACEKPILDEDIVTKNEANVILHMTQFEQTAFTRAATNITDLCTRLNIAIFDADGTKVNIRRRSIYLWNVRVSARVRSGLPTNVSTYAGRDCRWHRSVN